MSWQTKAAQLAALVTHPGSRWRRAICALPRHEFVPRSWNRVGPAPGGHGFAEWELFDGSTDEERWLNDAYANRSLVTEIGGRHADDAALGDRTVGRPTSSATMPGLVVQMFRHALIDDGVDVLDVGTGSGYGTALLATRLGADHVTSVDVASYLTEAARQRLGALDLRPTLLTCDATGELPGSYDRIIATVAVRPIPASWLAALPSGGRLVTTLTDTGLILTADKTDDGGATGRIEWDRAGFMGTRSGADYPPTLAGMLDEIRDSDGDSVSAGRYPVVNVVEAWELWSTLSVTAPGIEHHYQADGEDRTAFMLHADGSWARAVQRGDHPPTVHQSGPRRLWDLLDDLRHTWLRDGSLPVYGAKATVAADGTIHLRRGRWQATIA